MSYLLTSEEVQSSSEAQSGVLENGIDADISTCFITNTETDPWWIIDLEMDYIVSSIVLTTAQDQTGLTTNIRLILVSPACTYINMYVLYMLTYIQISE